MRAFVPPPPFWRSLTTNPSTSLRNGAAITRMQDESSLSSVGRLRAMQEAILKRRAALQTRDSSNVSEPKDDDIEALLNSSFPQTVSPAVRPVTQSSKSTSTKSAAISQKSKGGKKSTKKIEHVSQQKSSESSSKQAQAAHFASKSIPNNVGENHNIRTVSAVQGQGETNDRYVSIPRFDGRLPRHGIVPNLTTVVENVELPSLTNFLADPGFPRTDGELPKVTLQSFATSVVAPNQQPTAPTESCATSESIDSDCASILNNLNKEQRNAVLADHNQACIVLAGPGSGKTRVLTHRISYMLHKYNIPPQSVLAVTFTNKAASEMRGRVATLLQRSTGAPEGYNDQLTNKLTLCTFHSLCLRLLREFGEEIGIPPNFQVCDTSDSRTVISRLRKDSGRDGEGAPTEDRWRALISRAKNGISEDDQKRMFNPTYVEVETFRKEYDAALRAMKCLDFDDLLLEARRMLQESPSVLSRLQGRYHYVLVDEWQDTNQVQFDVVSLLSSHKKNLFVVGDADQSIYKFRGANSGNLESFSDAFKGASRIMLAQNYRSTACIVKAAQAVISEDRNRPPKEMTTSNRFGAQVKFHEKADDRDEARYVAMGIQTLLQENRIRSFSDCAVLFRKNAQSRAIEEACIKCDIAYKLLSGTRFYDRKEIKDMLGYTRLLCNPEDDVAFERIVNIPPRGVGKKTTEMIERVAKDCNTSMMGAVHTLVQDMGSGNIKLENLGITQRQWKGIKSFKIVMEELKELAAPLLELPMDNNFELEDTEDEVDNEEGSRNVGWLMLRIMEKTGYRDWVERSKSDSEFVDASGKSSQALDRLDNLKELVVGASRHTNLRIFQDHVMLMNDTSDEDEKGGAVSLMTLHGGKGLEFEAVFIVGVENGLIPMKHDESDEEEERRLLYVGMTRAKQFLTMTWRRNVFRATGKRETRRRYPSPFLNNLPANLIKRSAIREDYD